MSAMTWEKLRKRALERMSEYSAGAAEHPLRSSMSAQTIYDRMIEVYRDIIGEVQQKSSDKLETTTTLAYPANAISTALPAVCLQRPVLGVEWQINANGDVQPLQPITRAQLTNYLRDYGNQPGMLVQPFGDLWYFLENQTLIRIVPRPAQAMTLTIRYVPGVADLVAPTFNADGTVNVIGDGGGTPDLLAEEHHALIALKTARSFLSEVGSATKLDDEIAIKTISLMRWADASPQDGPRYVSEE